MFELQSVNNDIVIEGFNSIYYYEFSKDFNHEPEQHDFWEMVYVDSGSVNAITIGVGCTLSQGQVIFHEPMETHAHVSDSRVANSMLVVSFTCNSPVMQSFRGKTFTLDKTSKILLSLFLEEAKNALGSVPSDYRDRKNLEFSGEVFGSSQLLSCHLTEFLIKLARSSDAVKVTLNKQSRDIANNSICELVCEYMRKNLDTNITLKELCDVFLMGKTQMCRIFRDCMGKSPMEYYNSIKIKEAKKLLREKQYTVSQISDMLGYSSIHTFSRSFKTGTGHSPMEYVKSIL